MSGPDPSPKNSLQKGLLGRSETLKEAILRKSKIHYFRFQENQKASNKHLTMENIAPERIAEHDNALALMLGNGLVVGNTDPVTGEKRHKLNRDAGEQPQLISRMPCPVEQIISSPTYCCFKINRTWINSTQRTEEQRSEGDGGGSPPIREGQEPKEALHARHQF